MFGLCSTCFNVWSLFIYCRHAGGNHPCAGRRACRHAGKIGCRECERYGHLRVARLIEEHGAGQGLGRLLELLSADCPRHQRVRSTIAAAPIFRNYRRSSARGSAGRTRPADAPRGNRDGPRHRLISLNEKRAAELARLTRLSFGDDLSFGHGVVANKLEPIPARQGHENHTL
jgi:hypothetical protein